MTGCEHENVTMEVGFAKHTDGENGPVIGYQADIKLTCADCGEPFTFLGPAGFSPAQPMTSLDGLTLRAPLALASERRAVIDTMERAVGRPGAPEA